MAPRKLEELAAGIAEIEAAGTGRSQRPRPRADVTERASDEVLPARDVNDDRGPSVVDVSGQAAHDEALGVGLDEGPLGSGKADKGRTRTRRAKPAPLAFSEPLPHQRALELAYKLVSQRERTARQVREKLAAKDCEPPEIAAAIDELERHGFLDDRRYAKLYAEDKRRLQGWGERRIRLELGRAGIRREILQELFAEDEEALDAPSELEAALELLARKQPDLTDPKVKQRMAAMLARRGIGSPIIYAALREHERREQAG